VKQYLMIKLRGVGRLWENSRTK